MNEPSFQHPTDAVAPIEPVRPYEPAPPNYEGADPNMLLPAKGEPVYVDHPFCVRDEIFAACLTGAAFGWFLEVMSYADKAITDEMQSWLQGEIPIPGDVLERLLEERSKHAKREGIELEPARKIKLTLSD